jgi:Holliday junction DNA helicase RuvA
MIAHLAGTVLASHPGFLILDVGGVGYRVSVTERTRTTLHPHEECSLYIHTAVREDAINLFGFPSFEELELFELLIGISGIGPRSALGIIGLESVETLVSAIAAGDVAYLTKVSGVGKKSAEKIVLELQDKVAALPRAERKAIHDGEEDILEALRALGYRADEAREALHRIPDDVVDQGARIKEALRLLSRS